MNKLKRVVFMFSITQPLGVLLACSGVFMAEFFVWQDMYHRCLNIADESYCLGKTSSPQPSNKEAE